MRLASRKAWVVVGALGVAIVLALGWALLLSPQQSDIDSINSQIAQQQTQNAQTAATIAKLEKQVPQLPAAKAQLAALTIAIPTSLGMPQLLLDLNALATASGSTLASVTPGPAAAVQAAPAKKGAASPNAGLMSVPLAISVTGSYAQVQKFVLGLEKLPRAVLTGTVSVDPLGSADASEQFTGTIGAFVFYNAGPQAGAPAGTTAGGSTAKPSPAASPSPSASTDPALETGS